MKVAFDVDGTLIDGNLPRHEIVELLNQFVSEGAEVIVWSGGGVGYAKQRGLELDLPKSVAYHMKGKSLDVDLCFDDNKVALAKVNIKI